MKKMNARRFVSFALVLMLILPVISIPTFATETSQTSTPQNQVVGTLKALFEQDFEAFDTLKGPVAPASGVFKGPNTARIVPAADGRGNVLQIDCKAMSDNGEYWICFNNNNNIWIKITNPVIDVNYLHPDSEEGKGSNISDVDPFGQILDFKTPHIHTPSEQFVADALLTTSAKATYHVRGYINTVSCQIECKLFEQREIEYEYEYVQDYEYEYEYLYQYVYEYEYEYLYQKNEDGTPVLDEMGNKIYILDDEGQKIVVTDEEGNPVYAVDSNGKKIPKKDSKGHYVIAKDEDGNNLYELDEDGNKIPVRDAGGRMIPLYYPDGTRVYSIDEKGNKIPVPQLDAEGNPMMDEEGNPVYKLAYNKNGNPVPKYDKYGLPVPALDDDGNIVYKTDADGNKIPLLDAKGRNIYKEVPLNEINHNGTKAQPAKDENGNDIWRDVLDENGNPIMIPALNPDGTPKMVAVMIPELDANGNPVYIEEERQKTDENGAPVYDDNGDPVMEIVKIQKLTAQTQPKKDENGNIIYKEQRGRVYEQATNPDGSLKYDRNGNPVWVQDTNPDGSPKFDSKGNPVYKAKYVIVTQEKKDENGNPIMQNVLDENGNPIWEQLKDENGVPMIDENGHPVMGFRQEVATEIVYEQQKDENGKPVYDDNGDPVMVPKTKKVLIDTYKVITMETVMRVADPVKKQEQVMIQVPITTISSVYLTNSSVKDARGGYNNVAKPAYIQSAAITSNLLVFSTDYYFSADDPNTPENEALSHGIDIRISVLDEAGVSKNFDFVSCDAPSDGYINIKAHADAPTKIVDGSVKVPLGTWCNILIIADFSTGTYALYVNGDLIAVRQQVEITDQKVMQDRLVNTQTDKPLYVTDENGNFVMTELLDENGDVVMTVQKDENGNDIVSKKVDENGNYVYDDDGNIVMEPMMVPVMVPAVQKDADGNVLYEQVQKKDANGNIVWKDVLDENGNPIMIPQTDADGNPVMGPKYDENGNIVRDENGAIVMEPIMVTQKEIVYTNAQMDMMQNVLDEDGNLVTAIKTDANGNPILVSRVNNAGETVMVPMMVPVQKNVKEVALDENGNPIQDQVTVKLPAGTNASRWTHAAVSMKGGTWNLGHFKRGGTVTDYRGYMQIDNLAIYDGKDFAKVMASKGYNLDMTETYEALEIGSSVSLGGKEGTSSVIADLNGDKVVQIDYTDSASNDANYMPAMPGFSYMTSDKIVLEANYFLAEGSSGKFQSQFRYLGANLDVPEAPFEYSYIASNSRAFDWVDLYTIRTDPGNTAATVFFIDGSDGRTAQIDLGKWHAFSTVIDLKEGTFTLYIDGVDSISGQLVKNLTVSKEPTVIKKFNLKNISVAGGSWIVSKINKDQPTPNGSFYVDDVTVATLGGKTASMERVQGLLSADIYANGEYVTTVTDHNIFFTSEKIEIRNKQTFDLGSDELLHTDDTTIRFTSPTGLRFSSKVDIEALEALYDMIKRPANPEEEAADSGEEDDGVVSLRAVRFGTLIVPTDMLDGKELTFETLEDNNIEYLDVRGTLGYYYDLDGDGEATHIVGSITNLKEENIDRLFSGVTYIHIILENGIEYNVYAHRTAKTSAQSLADDAYGEFSPAEQAVIDAFLAGRKPAADIPTPVVTGEKMD